MGQRAISFMALRSTTAMACLSVRLMNMAGTRTLERKPFNVVAFDAQFADFLVCMEVDRDQEGMVQRNVFTSSDHVDSLRGCIDTRRVAPASPST